MLIESIPKVIALANWLVKGEAEYIGAAANGKVEDPLQTETKGKVVLFW